METRSRTKTSSGLNHVLSGCKPVSSPYRSEKICKVNLILYPYKVKLEIGGQNLQPHCSCNDAKILFVMTTDMPGYVDSTLGLLGHIKSRLNQGDHLHLLDVSSHLTLYSSRNAMGFSPVLNYVSDQSNFQLRKVDNRQQAKRQGVHSFSSEVDSYLHSFLLDDRIKGNLLAKALRRRASKASRFVYTKVSTLLEGEHFCSAIVLNGRDPLGAATKLAAQNNSVAIFFWEHSPENKIYLCSHPPQDYFSYEKELTTFSPSPIQVKDAENWFLERTELRSPSNPYSIGWSEAVGSMRSREIDFCIFTSSQDEFWALGDLFPKKLYKDFYEEVAKVLRSQENDKLHFVLRLHPNTLSKSVSYAVRDAKKALGLRKEFPGLRVIWPHEKTNSYDLMRASRCVLVENSTVGVEAAWLEVPVRYLGPSIYVGLSSAMLYRQNNGTVDLDDYKLARNRELAINDVSLLRSHMRIEYEPRLMVGWDWQSTIRSISGPWTIVFLLLRALNPRINKLFFSTLSLLR